MPEPASAPVAQTTPRPSRRFVRWAAIIAAYMAVGTIITVGVAWGFAVRWQTRGWKGPVVEDSGTYRHDLGFLKLGRKTGLGFETIDVFLVAWNWEGGMPTNPAEIEAEKDQQWAWWNNYVTPPPRSTNSAQGIPLLLALDSFPPDDDRLFRLSLSTGWPIPALTMHADIYPSQHGHPFDFSGFPIVRTNAGEDGVYLPIELRRGFAADAAFWSLVIFGLFRGAPLLRSLIRTRHGRCGRCGYSVAGLSGTTCPECGSPTPAPRTPQPPVTPA